MHTTRATRRVNAPRAAVYRALLDPEAVARWRVPDGMSCRILAFDAREGGAFRVSLHYEAPGGAGKSAPGTDIYRGRFLRLVPDERVEEELAFEATDPAFSGTMRITTVLTDAPGGGTDVHVLHEGLPDAVRPEDNAAGTRMALANLARLVEAPAQPDAAAAVPGPPRRPEQAERLGLEPHPEGGWYRRLWAASEDVATARGRRAAATAIHFLLAPGERSRRHRVASDELWLWQGGGALLLTHAGTPAAGEQEAGGGVRGPGDGGPGAGPGGDEVTAVLGPEAVGGRTLWAVVPAGRWQAARALGTEPALVACVVAPGFAWQDFTLREE